MGKKESRDFMVQIHSTESGQDSHLPDALAFSSSAGAACRFKQAVAGEEARRARLAEVVQGWAVLM